MEDPVRTLKSVLTLAEWAQSARQKLVRVRLVDESDTETLDKVIDDWFVLRTMIYEVATDDERRLLLDSPRKGYLPHVLRAVLKCKKQSEVLSNKGPSSPVHCTHANECPNICPCGDGCYCKSNICAPRST